jgi:hypothetical protein
MPILKQATISSGAVLGFHRPLTLRIDTVLALSEVHLVSYVDEAAYLAGKPIAWNWDVSIALSALTGDIIAAMENALITQADSPFVSGTIIADGATTLAAAKTRKIATLRDCCQTQIFAGYTSAALGASHTYPAKEQDQVNLAGSIIDSLLPGLPANYSTPLWCADAGGTWAQTQHTAAQIQQVGKDAKAAVVAAITKNATLAQQVMAATTADGIAAIAW